MRSSAITRLRSITGRAVTDNPKLKYLTSFKDRHGRRWYYFCYRGQKFKLPATPATAEFMAREVLARQAMAKREAAGRY